MFTERVWCWVIRSQLFLLIAGYYMYIETSTGLVGNKAVLVSPRYQQAYSTAVLSFWYHMYGRTIGRLSVYLNDGINRTRMWTLYGLYSCNTRNRNQCSTSVFSIRHLPRFELRKDEHDCKSSVWKYDFVRKSRPDLVYLLSMNKVGVNPVFPCKRNLELVVGANPALQLTSNLVVCQGEDAE